MLTTQIVLGHYGHFDDGIEILALNSLDVELNDKSPSIFTRQYAATDKCGIKLYIPDTTLSNESL